MRWAGLATAALTIAVTAGCGEPIGPEWEEITVRVQGTVVSTEENAARP